MNPRRSFLWAFGLLVALGTALGSAPRADTPDPKPPGAKPAVRVFILLGQSNMVGMGDISGGSSRWGQQFLDPVVSVYPGDYSEEIDYDQAEPTETLKLEDFGGVRPTPYPRGGTRVVRGRVRMKKSGIYRFKPGYADSTINIMEVDGREVHRQELGQESVFTDIELTAGKDVPFRITYLTGAADGLGWVQKVDIPGTLETIVKKDRKFPHLVDAEGRWAAREDVIYKGVISAVGEGPLRVGIQGSTIGPELGFGHVVGDHLEEPVLLIKASIGNRSLGWDILPPGSQRFTHDGRVYAGYKDSPGSWPEGSDPKPIDWYAGKQYDDFVQATREVLDGFDRLFPAFKDRGYEVAGFAWWQGHKDGNAAHASRYEENLVRLIRTLRKDFEAPKAPFVIATIGFEGWKMQGPHLTVAEAQLAVSGEKGKYPEFRGNVLTVETRDFWPKVEESPRNQGYHYHRNAGTYYLVGEAMGRGMVRLLQSTPAVP